VKACKKNVMVLICAIIILSLSGCSIAANTTPQPSIEDTTQPTGTSEYFIVPVETENQNEQDIEWPSLLKNCESWRIWGYIGERPYIIILTLSVENWDDDSGRYELEFAAGRTMYAGTYQERWDGIYEPGSWFGWDIFAYTGDWERYDDEIVCIAEMFWRDSGKPGQEISEGMTEYRELPNRNMYMVVEEIDYFLLGVQMADDSFMETFGIDWCLRENRDGSVQMEKIGDLGSQIFKNRTR